MNEKRILEAVQELTDIEDVEYGTPRWKQSFTDRLRRIIEKAERRGAAESATIHPTEVPDDAVELAKAVEQAILQEVTYQEAPNGRGGLRVLTKGYTKAAALLTAYHQVPRAMLRDIETEAWKRGVLGNLDFVPIAEIAAKYHVTVKE